MGLSAADAGHLAVAFARRLRPLNILDARRWADRFRDDEAPARRVGADGGSPPG